MMEAVLFLTRQKIRRLVIGPPMGGALYSRFGFRAPFILGEVCTVVDLLGRILIIERKDLINWNVEPEALSGVYDSQADLVSYDNDTVDDTTENTPLLYSSGPPPTDITSIGSVDDHNGTWSPNAYVAVRDQPLSLVAVVTKLAKSRRALVALIITFSYG